MVCRVGIPLENVISKSLLGVTINHNMSWENHTNFTVSKINKNITLLRRIKRYLPLQTRKLFFNTNILPHMDYCFVVWGSSRHVKKITLAQKRPAWVTLDIMDNCYPSKDVFLTLSWNPILWIALSIIKPLWSTKVSITCVQSIWQICLNM